MQLCLSLYRYVYITVYFIVNVTIYHSEVNCIRSYLSKKIHVLFYSIFYLSALQCFGFPWNPAAKAIRWQELAERFRPKLSPDAQDREFAKNRSCIQILDAALRSLLSVATKNIHSVYNDK